MSASVKKSKRILLTVSLSLVIILMTFTVAYAAFFTINTNDGVIDTHWPVTPTVTDPIGDASAGYDIKNFWFGTNGNPPTEFYFRAELTSPMTVSGNDFFEVRLDCNNNDTFFDGMDILVDYGPIGDAVMVYNGTLSSADSLSSTFGERIGTTNVYEFKASTNGPNVNWSTCKSASQIQVMLVSMTFDGISEFIDKDLTTPKGYNVPTAITLQHLDGAAVVQPGAALALAGILGLVGLVLARSARRKA